MSDSFQGRSLSRRTFLKATGAVGAVGAIAGGLATTETWFAPAPANAAAEERVACTFHQNHCAGMCSLRCTVRDGRLVLIEPNKSSSERYEVCCLKGLSEIQHIYGDGRVQTPMKRVGDRGSDQYEPVSWDEALDDICEKVKASKQARGDAGVLVMQSGEAGVDFKFVPQILGSSTPGAQNQGIDIGTGNGHDPTLGGLGGGYSMCTSEPRDWVNSKLVLTVGSNFCESSLVSSREFFEAQNAGARMITVDPHFSTTAGKSDEWVPIIPGTDAAFYLGMISHILDNDLIDKDFVKEHTSLPFLVDTATGKFIREHEPVEIPDVETGETRPETGTENPFYVIDPKTGKAVSYLSCKNPDLRGSTKYKGANAKTAFSLLEENQKPYTVQWASELTGIPGEKIIEIAELYAEGPSAIAFGWGGGDKMSNADIAGHACAMLTCLTGNIGKHGAGSGVWLGPIYSGYSAPLGAWELPESMAAGETVYDLRFCREKGETPDVLICIGDNPAQYGADMNRTKEWFDSIGTIVIIDPYFRETSKYADYVLPTTTRFEQDEEIGNLAGCYNQIGLQEKIVDPLFEAKTALWIEHELAKRMGNEDGLPKTAREYCEKLLSASEDPYYNKLTIDKIVENGGVWPMQGIEKPRLANFDLIFPTPTTRLEPYYESMLPFKQALPTWEPCTEATADNELREKYPLQLSNVRSRYYIHDQFYSAEWTMQYHKPVIELNPEDMKTRGLENGDDVKVFNDRGSFEIHVRGTEAVRPGSARIIEGVWSKYLIDGNLQDVTSNKMVERGEALMMGSVTPFSDTLVEVSKA